jgi:hypothetical protein
MPWNTTCKLIVNSTTDPFYVIDKEDPGYQLAIPPTDVREFDVVIPHCDFRSEVQEKAFLFFQAGSPNFYIFQQWGTSGTIRKSEWVGSGSLPSFPGDQLITEESAIDVFIDQAGRPLARRAI